MNCITWESCGRATSENPLRACAATSEPISAPISKPAPILMTLLAVSSHEVKPRENGDTTASKSHEPQENMAPDPVHARLNGTQRGHRPRRADAATRLPPRPPTPHCQAARWPDEAVDLRRFAPAGAPPSARARTG